MKRRTRTLLVAAAVLAAAAPGLAQKAGETARLVRSAEQGDAESHFHLATVIAGEQFTSGRELMVHLLVLGQMYRDGPGLPGNDVAAYKWMDVSNRWDPDSMWSTLQEELDRLAEGMTAAQLAEAKRAADTFLATYRDS